MPTLHSDLPIVTPDPPRMPASERYGSLYYLAIGGLATVVALIVYFGVGAWGMRDYFGHVYVLHDPQRSEADRVDAAYQLSRSPKAHQREFWDDALDRELPPLARYVMAESLSAEATESDPRGYALAVARSEGWPDWLRLLLVRPMAYAAASGATFPPEALRELRQSRDPAIPLWTAFVQAAGSGGDASARSFLESRAKDGGDVGILARLLLAALQAEPERRGVMLDRATLEIRRSHPEALEVWKGWEVRDGHLARGPVPNLRENRVQTPPRPAPGTGGS